MENRTKLHSFITRLALQQMNVNTVLFTLSDSCLARKKNSARSRKEVNNETEKEEAAGEKLIIAILK